MEAIVILSCHLWLQEEHMDPFFPDQEYMKVQETKVAQNESSLRSLSSFPVIYNSRRNISLSLGMREQAWSSSDCSVVCKEVMYFSSTSLNCRPQSI